MDSDSSRMFILLFFIIIKIIVICSEYAIIEINEMKIKESKINAKKRIELLEIMKNPVKTIAAFNTSKFMLNIMISILTFIIFKENMFLAIIENFNIKNKIINISVELLVLTLLIIALSFVLIVFTELLPKKIAEKHIVLIAKNSIKFIKLNIIFMTPLSFIIKVVNDVFCKLLNLPISHKEDVVTEEGILMMVEVGNETGVLEESQKEMINNIFEFGDVTVSEVMTHRTNIVAIDINSKIADVVYLAVNEGFSRMPVYENTIDTIIGIIYVKDLLCLIGCDCSENFSLKDFIRDVIYVPDTSKCDSLFEQLTKKKMQMAIVVDEYGGTSGIITMEDLIEEIVGNIQDEYDEDEVDIVEVDKNIFTIKGSADPEEIFEKLNINLPSHQDYNTMSAFIVDLIGRIPAEDEAPSVNYENVEFTVLLMEDNWVSKIKAVIKS